MAFQSISKGSNGGNGYTRWGVECHTVQDLQADPTGNTIYAVGTLTVRDSVGNVTQTQVDNRGFSISPTTGKTVLHPPFYKLADAKKCLNQLYLQLVNMGNQIG